MGGISEIVSTGRLDSLHMPYMAIGHSKYGPDLVARGIAGKLNN